VEMKTPQSVRHGKKNTREGSDSSRRDIIQQETNDKAKTIGVEDAEHPRADRFLRTLQEGLRYAISFASSSGPGLRCCMWSSR